MKTPDEKRRELLERAISKIRWGERPGDVQHWLEEQPSLSEEEAKQILEEACQQRRVAIRKKGIVHAILGTLGLILVAAFFYIRFFSGVIFYGVFSILATVAAVLIGVLSLRTILQSASWLATGRTEGSVD